MRLTNFPNKKKSCCKQQGLTMIEVLVAILIVSIALIGTAALQMNAMKMNESSQFRNQAVFLSSDLIERMEANKTNLQSYFVSATNCPTSPPAPSDNCNTAVCTSSDLVAYDLAQWENSVASTLPGCSWKVFVEGRTATITLTWQEKRGAQTYDTSGQLETFSYSVSRTFANP